MNCPRCDGNLIDPKAGFLPIIRWYANEKVVQCQLCARLYGTKEQELKPFPDGRVEAVQINA